MSKPKESFLSSSEITGEVMSTLKKLAISGIDVDAVMASQGKNIEALARASRTVTEGVHAVGKRQAEILRDTMGQTAHSLEALVKSGGTRDVAATQLELTKHAFEHALSNMRELAEMVTRAQHDALDTIGHRVIESLDEIKHMALKTTAPSAPKTPSAEASNRSHV